jgi:hypothetical protein
MAGLDPAIYVPQPARPANIGPGNYRVDHRVKPGDDGA